MQEFVGSCLRAVCTIRGIRGTVKGSDTRSETSVSGSVTGGGAYGNSGYQQSVGGQISSHTTRFQNVFLTDAEGQDHAIELVDLLVPCQEGHDLSLAFVGLGRKGRGFWIKARNHTTRQDYLAKETLRELMFPKRTVKLLIGVITLGVAGYQFMTHIALEAILGAGLFGLLAFCGSAFGFWGPAWLVGRIRTAQVLRNPLLEKALS